MKVSTFPTLFISHGGGPWPFLDGWREQYARTVKEFEEIPRRLPTKPKAILVISAHWSCDAFTVSTGTHPPMLYDYSGFPEHTYRIQYPAPGSPNLAARARELLHSANITTGEDAQRGFDSATFIPLGLMFPGADVPVVMLSLRSGLDPDEHLHVGRALLPLRQEGVLIVGSGLTYHNMGGFGHPETTAVADAFEGYLNRAVTQPVARLRDEMLLDWEEPPVARAAHPHEDHLMPLMVVAGAAGRDVGKRILVDHVSHVTMASYQFG